MVNLKTDRIKKRKPSKKISDYFTNEQYKEIQNALWQIFNSCGKDWIQEGDFTRDELQRLEIVRNRRKNEEHYHRFHTPKPPVPKAPVPNPSLGTTRSKISA